MTRSMGLDFGTTNTVLARAEQGGAAAPIPFRYHGDVLTGLRSALCFWQEPSGTQVEVGPWAIEQFIADPMDCRFLQSLKSFAAQELFQGTHIFGRRYRFEDLLATFYGKLQAHRSEPTAGPPQRLIVGRPVRYAGASPDEALAMQRYRDALAGFGFAEVHHVYEPVAAAFYFARRLKRSATVLVADFGGGTTDYSVMRFELDGGAIRPVPLAHSGVGVAGDTFDYRIIDNVISPRLGKGTRYTSWGKSLDIPSGHFHNFARWNLLSVMKASPEFADLKRIAPTCSHPELIGRLISVIENDQGYPLYRAVAGAKERLSRAEETDLEFAAPGFAISARLTRTQFEGWIAEDLERIEAALDEAMAKAGLGNGAIDAVFLTGGTSFVPAVRRLFATRFGAQRIESGDELVSIANGLALIGERDDLEQWTVAAPASSA